MVQSTNFCKKKIIFFQKENALFECGYRRQLATKFEDFIEYLINLNDDFVLDKNSLQEFNKLFVWAMLDPMVGKIFHLALKLILKNSKKFDNDQLRKMNKLINSFIERFLIKKKFSHFFDCLLINLV